MAVSRLRLDIFYLPWLTFLFTVVDLLLQLHLQWPLHHHH